MVQSPGNLGYAILCTQYINLPIPIISLLPNCCVKSVYKYKDQGVRTGVLLALCDLTLMYCAA
jgi:hypothetical protein